MSTTVSQITIRMHTICCRNYDGYVISHLFIFGRNLRIVCECDASALKNRFLDQTCVCVGYCVVDDNVVKSGKVPYIEQDDVRGLTAGDKILHVGDPVDRGETITIDECNRWLELFMQTSFVNFTGTFVRNNQSDQVLQSTAGCSV